MSKDYLKNFKNDLRLISLSNTDEKIKIIQKLRKGDVITFDATEHQIIGSRQFIIAEKLRYRFLNVSNNVFRLRSLDNAFSFYISTSNNILNKSVIFKIVTPFSSLTECIDIMDEDAKFFRPKNKIFSEFNGWCSEVYEKRVFSEYGLVRIGSKCSLPVHFNIIISYGNRYSIEEETINNNTKVYFVVHHNSDVISSFCRLAI